jgi:hypothetical protein
MGDVRYMDIGEFCDIGFLQEANRLYFHPHGMALAISLGFADRDAVTDWLAEPTMVEFAEQHDIDVTDAFVDNAWATIQALELDRPRLLGVWDGRDDPEGFLFVEGCDSEKVDRVFAELTKHLPTRVELMGTAIQPAHFVPPARDEESSDVEAAEAST